MIGMDWHYILDAEHRPVKVSMAEFVEWASARSANGEDFRRVALDETRFFEVSTVFLGLDHNWRGKGPPILFETMAFERERQIRETFGKLWSVREDTEQHRYSSWDDAVAGHQAIVRRLQKQEADALDALPKLRAKRGDRAKP